MMAGKKAGAHIVYVDVPRGNHMGVVAPQLGLMLEFFVKQKKLRPSHAVYCTNFSSSL